MQAESLGDLINDNNAPRAATVPPSENIINLSPGEKIAWDLVETYLLANPDKSKEHAFLATGAIRANYYAARKKAMASNCEALSTAFKDSDRKQRIRPEDRIVRNIIRPTPETIDREIKRVRTEALRWVDSKKSSAIIEEPESEATEDEPTVAASDRESLNQILDALEGWDLPIQKRIVETACAFLGLKMFWRE